MSEVAPAASVDPHTRPGRLSGASPTPSSTWSAPSAGTSWPLYCPHGGRVSPRIVKRAIDNYIDNYQARGPRIDRTSYKPPLNILALPRH